MPTTDFPVGTVALSATQQFVEAESSVNNAVTNTAFEGAQEVAIDAVGTIVSGLIAPRQRVATPGGDLEFPTQPGSLDEPGHRHLLENDSGRHGIDEQVDALHINIPVVQYNFQSDYGTDPQGNPLANAITEEQKQRTREIFEIYSYYTGIRFIETLTQGLHIVTGDPRALDPNQDPGPGLLGLAEVGIREPEEGGFIIDQGLLAVMNSLVDWKQSEFGGSWYNTAMHEIGHLLGLPHTYDLPTTMGASAPGDLGEESFPGAYDISHLLQFYPKLGSDIDVYKIIVDEPGVLSAETIVARPGQTAISQLDSVLTIYRESELDGITTRRMIGRNNDSVGRDSLLNLHLDTDLDSQGNFVNTTYYVAVTSVGNTDFNPEVEESGYGGRSEGAYQLQMKFDADPSSITTIKDASGQLFDGDRDGVAGGTYKFWFKTAAADSTAFVDKIFSNVVATTTDNVADSASVNLADSTGINKGMFVVGDGVAAGIVVENNNELTAEITLSQNVSIEGETAEANATGHGTNEIEETDTSVLILDSTTGIESGMIVTGSGIPDGTTVLGVASAESAVTLSQPSSHSFNTTPATTTEIASESAVVTLADTTGLSSGMHVIGEGIASGTTVKSVDSSNQVTLSQAVSIESDTSLEFVTPITLDFVNPVTLRFITPAIDIQSDISPMAQASRILELNSTVGIEPGMFVIGDGVAVGTKVQSVDSPTELTLSGALYLGISTSLRFASLGDGSLEHPYINISDAIDSVDSGSGIIRVLGNQGTEIQNTNTVGTRGLLRPNARVDSRDASEYYIGRDDQGNPLSDGEDFNVPAGITLMVDAGAVIRMGQSNLDVGSSSPLVSRAQASVQILGIPGTPVEFTTIKNNANAVKRGFNSFTDNTSINTNRLPQGPYQQSGQWGGIVLREDSDSGLDGVFLNVLNHSVLSYGGGEVIVDSQAASFDAVQIESTRPSLGFNQITVNASSAISATPNSFLDDDGRAGLDLRGNLLLENSVNGVTVAINTEFGVPLETLDVAAKFNSKEVAYVLQENLVITGGAGGHLDNSIAANAPEARPAGRLQIEPGVVVKLQNARIELERGSAQLIAEGHASKPIVFTSLNDNRYGAGGTFDNNGNQPNLRKAENIESKETTAASSGNIINLNNTDNIQVGMTVSGSGVLAGTTVLAVVSPAQVQLSQSAIVAIEAQVNFETPYAELFKPNENTGEWGGIIVNAVSSASIDHAYIAFAGGQVPIEGDFASFNPVEVHQGNLRLANSRIEYNASGLATGDRNARGSNTAATVFVRNSEPLIIGNDFRRNSGAVISINANALSDTQRGDVGRQSGVIARHEEFDSNFGPLIRDNKISYVESATGETSQPGQFNIDVVFDSSLEDGSTAAANVKAASLAAAERWEQVIIGDISDQGLIDDFQMNVQAGLLLSPDTPDPSDGQYGILANAGPDLLRPSNDPNPHLPYTGSAGVDMADAGDLEALTETMIHEFGHALGFIGGVYNNPSRFNYLDSSGNYVGPQSGSNALAEYQRIAPGATSIPMEPGDDGHWNEAVFDTEIMTPIADINSVISTLTVGLLEDIGYAVDYSNADIYSNDGFSLLPPGAVSGIGGLAIRAQEITVESIWDDTDIIHVVTDEITIENFHTGTGLQLRSKSDESLVVKLDSADAGFTATGSGFDIDDRIGGVVQIIGQPGFPVILTSLADDSVGASQNILGFAVTDTNLDGSSSTAAPGDWRSLQFEPFSHDRNVAVFVESELTVTGEIDINNIPAKAEYIGVLAPNFATSTTTVTNSTESAQEKSGNENQRLGFEVNGAIAFDYSGDVDVYAFDGYAGSEAWIDIDKTSSSLDAMVELLDAAGTVLARSVDSQLDAAAHVEIIGVALPLEREEFRGGDFYTQNPRDPGFRVILPGNAGDATRYFLRVRSQTDAIGKDLASQHSSLVDERQVAEGKTSGTYQLRVRLRQRDEKPGSTVQYADIRYPRIGIDAVGLPSHSPLSGENGENPSDDNNIQANAQQLGNLLASDRGTISVAGQISSESDIDWYEFDIGYLPTQEEAWSWATVLDIDYADGSRGDLTLSVFNADGALIFVGRDSDIAEDQRGVDQENDFDDLTRGSLGKLDPFIGSAFLPAGNATEGGSETYYVAVSSNDFSASTLDQYYELNATTPSARLEPVSSIERIVEDHIGSLGYTSGGAEPADLSSRGIINIEDSLALGAHVRPFTLADMTGFLTTTGNLRTLNPYTGQLDAVPANNVYNYDAGDAAGDIDMRTDGSLFVYINEGGGNDGGNVGTVFEVNPGLDAGGIIINGAGDGISNDQNGTGTPPVPPSDNVWRMNDPTVDALVIGRSGFDQGANQVLYEAAGTGDNRGSETSATFYSIRDNDFVGGPGTRSVIYGAATDGNASMDLNNTNTQNDNHNLGRFGWLPGGNNPEPIGEDGGNNSPDILINGFTTGLQFRNDIRNDDHLYAVSQGGQFFRIVPRNATATEAAQTPSANNVSGNFDEEIEIADARDFSELLTGEQGNNNDNFENRTLEGLAAGPVNLEGGRYQGMFFAVTNFGELVCIDPDGNGDSDATIVDNVFDTDGDGIADSWISNSPNIGTGVRGFAFSQLDMNLWHPTNLREADAGHGVYQAPDNTRRQVPSQNTNTSMFFGLERDDLPASARYATYDGSGQQYGAQSQNGLPAPLRYNWQQDLSAGALTGSTLDANYNIAGGAHGSLITDPFSLAGYAGTDKPTLYFNYFLDTQEANSDTSNGGSMRDSARAFASRDGGVTWELLATNNSIRSGLDGTNPNAELPPAYSVSSQIGNPSDANGQANQRVQELFDSSGDWRQARIDLADFAGESSIVLRFDFSTGGDLDRNATSNAKIEPDAIRTVTTAAIPSPNPGNFSVVFDNGGGIGVGMHAMRLAQQNIEADIGPGDPGYIPPESVAQVESVTIDPVTLQATVEFSPNSDADGVTYQLDDEIAFFSAGIEKDNILSIASTIGSFASPQARSTENDHEGFYVDDIIVGFAERGEMVVDASGNTQLNNVVTFDDLETPQATQNDYNEFNLQGEYQLEIRRGTEYGTRDQAEFIEITQVHDTNDRHIMNLAELPEVLAEGNLAVDGASITSVIWEGNGNATAHDAILWALDLTTAVNPEGDVNAFLEFNYRTQGGRLDSLPANFNTFDSRPTGDGVAISFDNGINYTRISNVTSTGGEIRSLQVDLSSFGIPNATTILGFFSSGSENFEVEYLDAIIRTAPVSATTGFIGDRNIVREQGQFLIQNNIISDASQYGIRIDAARDPITNAPTAGVARNLPVLNDQRLVPGVVVSNNIVSGSGTAGILFSGDPNTGNVPEATVPYGRLINNTIYGGSNVGTGIEVTENAAPTILNNVFASLGTGVDVDSTSSSTTVIGTSAFHAVGTEVNGAQDQFGMTLSTDPFVNAEEGNFYPVEGAPIIDSSLGSLQDRPAITSVTAPVLIAESPIIAPTRDVFGQLRQDHPDFANAPGLGVDVFIDRGAVEHIDDVDPTASLISPLDGSSSNPTDTASEKDVVYLIGAEASQQLEFRIQLSDVGVGIDKSTVVADAVTLSRNEELLIEGEDYIFLFSENTNQIILKSSASYPVGDYLITLLSEERDAVAGTPAQLTDIAGNTLLSNTQDGSVTFFIKLEDLPAAPSQVEAQLRYRPAPDDDLVVDLNWIPPQYSNPDINEYVIQSSNDGGLTWVDYNSDAAIASTNVTIDDVMEDSTYRFRVAAKSDLFVNGASRGDWSESSNEILIDRTPSVPGVPFIQAEPDTLAANWSEPLFTGGLPLEYDVEVAEVTGGELEWTSVSDGDGDSSDLNATVAAVNGTTYRLRVRAKNTNDGGLNWKVSDWSLSNNSITPRQRAEAPLALDGDVGDQSISVWWSEPTETYGGTITDYAVYVSVNGNEVQHVDAESTGTPTSDAPLVITTLNGASVEDGGVALTNGEVYTVIVRAVTEATVSAGGTLGLPASEIFKPATVPGAPQNVTVVSGDATLVADWDAPLSDGGESIIAYDIEYSSNGFISGTIVRASDLSLTETIASTGIVNGNNYAVRVRTVVVINETEVVSPWSSPSVSVMPGRQASEPDFEAQPLENRVILSWNQPADLGGTSLLGFELYWRVDGASWPESPSQTFQPQNRLFVVNGLTNGTKYDFKLIAQTGFGQSQEAILSEIVPSGLPDAPTNMQIMPSLGSLDVSFEAPISDGGAEITDYVAEYSTNGGVSWTEYSDDVSPLTTLQITGLTNGISHDVRVAAKNSAGLSSWLTSSSSVTPGELASSPEPLTDSPGDETITLRWQTPENNGGSQITSYLVQKSLHGNDSWQNASLVSGNSLSVTVAGLQNGEAHDFRVAAVTNVGTGAYALLENVWSIGVADAPVGLGSSSLDSAVRLDWQAPASNGGAVITSYSIEYRLLGSDNWLPFGSSDASPFTVTGLTNGQTYEFQVQSVNSAGPSAFSSPISQLVGPVPTAPAFAAAGVGSDGKVAVVWRDAIVPDGVSLLSHTIEYRRVGEEAWTFGVSVSEPINHAKLSRSLFASGAYEFRVAAVATTGTGSYATTNSVNL